MDTRWIHPALAHEPVAWLGTAGPDGQAALVPTWFVWDGRGFIVVSKPGARKVRNARANPRVMLGIASVGSDLQAQLVEGVAEVLPEPSATALAGVDLSKYSGLLAADGLDREAFLARYSTTIRITPTRFLPWQGPALAREPESALPAKASGRRRARSTVPGRQQYAIAGPSAPNPAPVRRAVRPRWEKPASDRRPCRSRDAFDPRRGASLPARSIVARPCEPLRRCPSGAYLVGSGSRTVG